MDCPDRDRNAVRLVGSPLWLQAITVELAFPRQAGARSPAASCAEQHRPTLSAPSYPNGLGRSPRRKAPHAARNSAFPPARAVRRIAILFAP